MNEAFGSRQGNKHAPPDLSKDITVLMNSMQEHEVYTVKPGRQIEGDKAVVPEVISSGAGQIIGPLTDYNNRFEQLRRRRRLRPLVGAPFAFLDEVPRTHIPHSDPPVAPAAVDVDSSTTPDASGGLEDPESAWYIDDWDPGYGMETQPNGSCLEYEKSDSSSSTEASESEEEDLGSDHSQSESDSLADDEDGVFDLDLDVAPVFSLDDEGDVDIHMY